MYFIITGWIMNADNGATSYARLDATMFSAEDKWATFDLCACSNDRYNDWGIAFDTVHRY